MPEWWYAHDGEIYDMLCNLFCSGIGKNCVACIFDEMTKIPVKDYLALLHKPRAW